jgi:hypothetical protein
LFFVMDESLRFPVGRLTRRSALDPAGRAAAIAEIARLPSALSGAVRGLTDAQLDTPYREGGWTVRQVVHHLADSHVNAYVRCKLIVSEDDPPLKAYDQDAWSSMSDAMTLPVAISLALLENLHARWHRFLQSLDASAFGRSGLHTEDGPVTLDMLLQTYSWHGRHHVAHIRALRQRLGW